jgi:RNA polymerase sigma-70 factor (ECF subfamily)
MLLVHFLIIAMTLDGPEDDTPDVAKLVRQAQQGNREAVTSLYRLFAPKIFRYLVRRLPTTEDAEDVMGEVFVGMVEGLAAYKDTGAPFESWLYRIASNQTIDFYRRTKRNTSEELSDLLSSDEDLPEDQVITTQNLQAMRDAIQQLPEEHQTILILRFVERKTHDEVAQLLGKSPSAIRTAQFRALSQLSELLGQTKARHYIRGRYE